jgi:ubiquinone/menaquinone biosynthesis C-methylase UbiE
VFAATAALGARFWEEAKRMKMTKFEKLFVNSPRRSRRVAEHAESMLRLVGCAPGQRYLDFGCGNGAAAIYLASKLGLEVTGIDVDPEQIEAARARSEQSTKVRFMTADGTQLPFGDNEFDFVATHMVTHHIRDWHEALRQMLRVLRPNGYLIYKDFTLPRWVASIGKRFIKSLGFPIAEELDRFAQENRLTALHRARSLNKYEVVWRKHAE